MNNALRSAIVGYFDDRLAQHGATPRGVDWNEASSQLIRLRQVLKVIDGVDGAFSLNDVGCGFGTLLDLIGDDNRITYRGFDLSGAMVDQARLQHGQGPLRQFSSGESLADLKEADFAVASGVFNMKLATDSSTWQQYVLASLDTIHSKTRRGFAFNLLTSYSDAEKMRPDLYYANPCFFFDYCKRKFGRNVALLHDYDLYDFTIIVRNNQPQKN